MEHSDGSPGRTLFGPSTDTHRFHEWIQTYQRPRTTSNQIPLNSVDSAIRQIETLNASRTYVPTLVYIGQLIEVPIAGEFSSLLTQLHQRASRMGAPIYSFNLGVDNNLNTQRINRIASIPTGAYQITDGQDANIMLQDFYSNLALQRLLYHVEYRVPTINSATDHYTVTLRINGTSVSHDYSFDVQPPLVVLTAPGGGSTFERTATVARDSSGNLIPD